MKVILQCICLALAVPSLAAEAAEVADITVTDATIRAGKLFIAGTTASGGMKVRLDGQTGTAYNVASGTTKAFTFDLVYLPGDCIVSLQKFTPPSTLGPATNWVVADCGARGLSPRGAWVLTQNYLTDDLVTAGGSSWRAKRNNTGKPPATNAADWENFTSKGAPGATGASGAPGASGSMGPAGPAGADGAAGEPGLQGPAGATGPAGTPGPAGVKPGGAWVSSSAYVLNDLVLFDGSTWRALRTSTNKSPDLSALDWEAFAQKGDEGAAGPAGPSGPQGPEGPVGVIGPPGPQGAAGVQGAQGAQGLPGARGATGETGATGATGIVTTVGFAGAGGTLQSNVAAFVFAGPTATVTTTAAQRFNASASVPAQAPVAVPVTFGLCYALQSSTAVFLLGGSNSFQTSTVGTTAQMLATSTSTVLSSPGLYSVGLCFRNLSDQIVTLQQVNGFVQVTN